MKKFLLAVLLLCSSCVGEMACLSPSEYDRNTAQEYYDTLGTYRVSEAVHNKVRKKFSCYYHAGDEIYAYKTFWDTKYVLVRRDKAVTYVEGK